MKHTFVSSHKHPDRPVYMDCNATAPMEPAVRDTVIHWLKDEIGNAGSRTHEYGSKAKRAVQKAREQVAAVIGVTADEVLFTSGATESDNLATLGLATYGESVKRRHIVSTAIEHKAVLEPLEALARRGFEITLVKPNADGAVSPDDIRSALRPDTLLVSVMHVNNETGVKQAIKEIAASLAEHDAYFHVDAAQGFGKDLLGLTSPRIDLISISSHKIYGPVGVGALVTKRRGFRKPPLAPLCYGGGQERGLRPGTLPVPLIVGFGVAAELAYQNSKERAIRCSEIRTEALTALRPLGIEMHGDLQSTLPHVINFAVPGIDAEALMVALKDLIAISNGSACTSQSYKPSHVLTAMGLSDKAVAGAVRVSWCHMTPDVDWNAIAQRIASMR